MSEHGHEGGHHEEHAENHGGGGHGGGGGKGGAPSKIARTVVDLNLPKEFFKDFERLATNAHKYKKGPGSGHGHDDHGNHKAAGHAAGGGAHH